MRYPNYWLLENLLSTASENHAEIDGKWMPARPLTWMTFRFKLKVMWGVWTGKLDVVEWPGGQ